MVSDQSGQAPRGTALEPPTRAGAARIDWAFVYGSIARAEERASSDIDLLIVGRAGLADIAPALRQAETRLNCPVNPILYTQEEFATQYTSGHAFLQAVLDSEQHFILGDPHALAATVNE